MVFEFIPKKDRKKILKSIINILKNNKLLTLSTVNKNQPCSNTAYYVFDDKLNLYVWGEKDTLKYKNIKLNNKVAVNVFDSSQKWGSLLQGIQALGNAYAVNNKELVKVGLLYIKRFPKVIKFVKTPRDFHNKMFNSQVYKIELNKIKVLDEKTFGKEEFRELIIKR